MSDRHIAFGRWNSQHYQVNVIPCTCPWPSALGAELPFGIETYEDKWTDNLIGAALWVTPAVAVVLHPLAVLPSPLLSSYPACDSVMMTKPKQWAATSSTTEEPFMVQWKWGMKRACHPGELQQITVQQRTVSWWSEDGRTRWAVCQQSVHVSG